MAQGLGFISWSWICKEWRSWIVCMCHASWYRLRC